ncbi:MAG: prolipoprotein diacylglyceryl transferase family protein [Thermocrispum sp.]
MDPQGLAATYWFDAPSTAGPFSVTVRISGIRTGIKGKPTNRDAFQRNDRVTGISDGGGRVALTTKAHGINPGEWRVTAEPVEQTGTAAAERLPRRAITTRTSFARLAFGPSVRVTAWPALVGAGYVVALLLQALLLARAGVAVLPALLVSLLASVLGFVGGKVYYLVLHRKHPREFLSAGACVQGFLITAFGALAVAVALLHMPVGVLLDATTPGLFLGLAIGRPGCFLTGCCAGRPTGSHWGLCSSDRRVVIRRVPVQLIEAVAALIIGIVALALVLVVHAPIAGAIFVGALAAYVLVRQMLFTLRANSRTPHGRAITMAIAGLVLLASLATPLVA